MSTTTYNVAGMTCGHCVASVTEEIAKVPGVVDVAVDLVTDGTSPVHVTSADEIDIEQIRAAVDEAGYSLVDASA